MTSSALVSYYEISPNPDTAGCMVTGDSGDGVVFHNVEPVSAEMCFIGRQAIIEAYAAITGYTPAQLKKLDKQAEELAEAKAKLKVANARLDEWTTFAEEAEKVGLIFRVME